MPSVSLLLAIVAVVMVMAFWSAVRQPAQAAAARAEADRQAAEERVRRILSTRAVGHPTGSGGQTEGPEQVMDLRLVITPPTEAGKAWVFGRPRDVDRCGETLFAAAPRYFDAWVSRIAIACGGLPEGEELFGRWMRIDGATLLRIRAAQDTHDDAREILGFLGDAEGRLHPVVRPWYSTGFAVTAMPSFLAAVGLERRLARPGQMISSRIRDGQRAADHRDWFAGSIHVDGLIGALCRDVLTDTVLTGDCWRRTRELQHKIDDLTDELFH